MKIYFYAAGQYVPDEHFISLYEAVGDLGEVVVLKNNLNVNLHLTVSLQHEAVMVLYAANRQALDELIAIRGVFTDFRVILVLPDMEGDSIRKGYLLKPSYMSNIRGDIGELREVIRKITLAGGDLPASSAEKQNFSHKTTNHLKGSHGELSG
ncbi:MAG: hypothetical protein ABFR63_04835 [Thermodesulfobacteriota bacterium]